MVHNSKQMQVLPVFKCSVLTLYHKARDDSVERASFVSAHKVTVIIYSVRGELD